MIRASDADGIVVVRKLRPAAVICALPEEDLPRSTAPFLPSGHSRSLPLVATARPSSPRGRLTTVDNVIDRKTGTFKLKAQFPNEKKDALARSICQCSAAPRHAARQHRSVGSGRAAWAGRHLSIRIAPDNTVATMRKIKVAGALAGCLFRPWCCLERRRPPSSLTALAWGRERALSSSRGQHQIFLIATVLSGANNEYVSAVRPMLQGRFRHDDAAGPRVARWQPSIDQIDLARASFFSFGNCALELGK